MTSNALATGRRTYLHESAALDFAIRACEALGLVFWALAPGTDIWATDYSQNAFRVTVGKTVGGMRKVSYGAHAGREGNGRRAYVAVGERRTVAQADQWSLFSIEDQAQDVAPVVETAETAAPVADTCAHVCTVAAPSTSPTGRKCDQCGAATPVSEWTREGVTTPQRTTPVVIEVDSIEEQASDVEETAMAEGGAIEVPEGRGIEVGEALMQLAAAQMAEVARKAETAAPVADTVESLDAELIATTNKGAREAILARRQMVLAELSVASDPGYVELIERTARGIELELSELDASTVADTADTAPVARALAVGPGLFQPQCACGWKGEVGKSLGIATADANAHVACDPAAPAEHTVSVEKVRMHSGPGWRAVCTCGHASVAYFAEHAADTMAQAHVKETSPKSRDAIEATATAQGWTIEPSITGDSQSTLTRAGVSIDLEYNVGGNVKRAGVYGQAFGSFGYGDRLAEVTPRDTDKRATVLAWLAAPVGATRAESRDAMRDHVIGAPAADTADSVAASNDAAFATGDPVTVRGEGTDGGDAHGTVSAHDGNVSVSLEDGSSVYVSASDVSPRVSGAAAANRWSTDGNRAYATMVGDFGHALATLTPYRDRYELAIEYAATGNRDVFPMHAGDVHTAITEAERRVSREALDASSNDVPAETEFAARVRTARAPKVPGIHVARCYRCGERACETLRLPVSSLTNVCSEHADEARAVALRWDAASRYMHEEAPHIASSGRLAVRFTREATNRLDIPLAVIAETLIGADNTFGDIDTTLAQRLDAFTAARGTAPSNPVVGK